MIPGPFLLRVTAACLLGGAVLAAQPPMPTPTRTVRSEIRAEHGVVAAGRTFTVDAGARVLASGGNAIDAGVASIFAAAVVEISHFGLGGEAPIIIYSARDRKVAVVNGQGPAPRAATPQLFAGKSAIPGNGPLGATVPAAVDSASIALAQYGTKSLADVLAPAIELADGFPMYEFLHHYLETERAASEIYTWSKSTYYPDGRITPVGEMFRQPNLAATLRAMAAGEKDALAHGATREAGITAGRDVFYKGPIAHEMTSAVREAGGVMTEEDLGLVSRRDRRADSRRRIAATRSTRPDSGTRGRRCCRRCAFSRDSICTRWGRGRRTRCTRRSKRSSSPMPTATVITAIRTSCACRERCCCLSPMPGYGAR